MAHFLLKDQVGIKEFGGKFNESWIGVPWLVFKTKEYLKCKTIEYLNDLRKKIFKWLTLESLVTWSLLLSLFSFLTAELALDEEELLLTALAAASLLFLLLPPLSFFPSLASRSFLRAAAPPSLRAWPIFRLILVKQPEQHFLVPSGISVKLKRVQNKLKWVNSQLK